MEELLEKLKDFILEHQEYFSELSEEDVPLEILTENNVLIHPVDISRYEENVLCVILPNVEQDDFENSSIGFQRVNSDITISFLNRGYPYETLIRQSCRFAAGLRKMLFENPTLGDSVLDFQFGNRSFYPDMGTVDRQMSAVEIELTLLTEEEI